MSTNTIPKVSVVVPVYNAGKYLRPCMDTLINQTLREIEIICVLDCPLDGSDRVIEEYAAKDDRIIIIRNQNNLNIGESRNVGLRAATGEYIGFSDHDDTRALDMYEKMYTATRNKSVNVVFSGKIVNMVLENYVSKFLHKKVMHTYPSFQIAALSLFPRPLPKTKYTGRGHVTPNLYKRDFILDHNVFFVDTKKCFAEDALFNMNVLSHIKSDNEIVLCQKDYYNFIVHGKNTHLSSWYSDLQHIVQYVHGMYDAISNVSWGKDEIKELLFILLIAISYSWFIKDAKSRGFQNSIKLLCKMIDSDLVCREIINKTAVPIYGLTIPKRIFALWIKRLLCRKIA